MKTFTKWLLRLLILVIAIILVVMGYLFWQFNKSLPQTTGKLILPGIQDQVSIIRDRVGIPHIFANSRHDLFFAMGVAHAQDRMFQMDLSRRAAYGRLSELIGKVTLHSDVQMRVLGLGAAADQSFEHLTDETKAAFRSYANGVNSIITASGYTPPPEYILLLKKPEPWRAQDSVAVLKMMAYGLSGDAFNEPSRIKLLDILGPERTAQFLAPYPDDAPITLSEADLGLAQPPPVQNQSAPTEFSSPTGELKQGSNNWVVDGNLTANGKPLLANDPHLALSTPGVWYFARLQAADEMVLGASLPGTPFITLGRNSHAAWGFTNTGPDTADLFVYPKDKLITTTEQTVIKIRGSEDKTIDILRTEQGPVLDPKWFSAAKIAKHEEAVIIQSTLDDGDDTTGDLGISLLTAKTFEDFENELQRYKMPQQNMVFADTTGTIGFIAPARIPVRDNNGNWVGEIPYSELPRSKNPDRHYYASANNKIVPDSYPHFLTGSWYGFSRIKRIVELLEQTELHDRRSFSRMQMDTVSDLARQSIALISASSPLTDGGKELRVMLSAWDGNLAADRPEGLVYSMWMRAFTKNLYQDDLGEDFERFWSPRREFVESVLKGVAASWCDDINTSEMENCRQIAAKSLDQVYAQLSKSGKTPIADLKWGEVHKANFAHPLFDKTPLRSFFSVQVPVGGDASTINVAHSSFASGNFDVLWGPSMRAIYDFSDLDSSLFMHGPGQSGNVMSPHYRDLAQAWANGDFVEIRSDWNPQSPPPNSSTLILLPKAMDK